MPQVSNVGVVEFLGGTYDMTILRQQVPHSTTRLCEINIDQA